MKAILFFGVFFIAIAFAFGNENYEEITADKAPVLTGGWREIEVTTLDKGVINFVKEYLSQAYVPYRLLTLSINRVWSQLIQSRRYLVFCPKQNS